MGKQRIIKTSIWKKISAVILFIALAVDFLQVTETTAGAGTANVYTVKVYDKRVEVPIGGAQFSHVFMLFKDGERIVRPKGVKYKSSDKSVVKVDKSGNDASFRGMKEGTAKITCTYKGASASITIKVGKIAVNTKAPYDINTQQRDIYLPAGQTKALYVESWGEGGHTNDIGTVQLSSSNPSVVETSVHKIEPVYMFGDPQLTYYNAGNLIAKKKGTATITAKCAYGTSSFKVKVIKMPKIKLKITEQQMVSSGEYNEYTYTIKNTGSAKIKAGGPCTVYAYRGAHTVLMKEKEKALQKGESATYTFTIPKSREAGDELQSVYISCGGHVFQAYLKEGSGTVESYRYIGKMPLIAAISEYDL